MDGRSQAGQTEQPDVQCMNPVEQGVLPRGDALVVVALALENGDCPRSVTRDERVVRPCADELFARHAFVARTERLHLAGSAQMLTRIENPQIPIRVPVAA